MSRMSPSNSPPLTYAGWALVVLRTLLLWALFIIPAGFVFGFLFAALFGGKVFTSIVATTAGIFIFNLVSFLYQMTRGKHGQGNAG